MPMDTSNGWRPAGRRRVNAGHRSAGVRLPELVAWTQLDLADPSLTRLRVTHIGAGLDKVGSQRTCPALLPHSETE